MPAFLEEEDEDEDEKFMPS